MHGTIDVASEYNVGSKFIVDIPFEIGKVLCGRNVSSDH